MKAFNIPLTLFILIFGTKVYGEIIKFTISNPGYIPKMHDERLNILVKAIPGYIVKFEPNIPALKHVHHMVLYGCTELEKNTTFSKELHNCRGPQYWLYGWAKNAPSLELPKEIGFPVGQKDNPIKYLGVNIHYANPLTEQDFSGMTLHITTERPRYLAGTFGLGSFYTGYIPPGRDNVIINMSCLYNRDFEIHPFAFRVHSHDLGKVISAYIVHQDNWTMVGKRNPGWLQLFQPIEKKLAIKKNDYLAAICRFDSSEVDEETSMGTSNVDEMCRFFFMYYHEADTHSYVVDSCTGNEFPEIMVHYPMDGITFLPSHPEWTWEHHRNKKKHKAVSNMK